MSIFLLGFKLLFKKFDFFVYKELERLLTCKIYDRVNFRELCVSVTGLIWLRKGTGDGRL